MFAFVLFIRMMLAFELIVFSGLISVLAPHLHRPYYKILEIKPRQELLQQKTNSKKLFFPLFFILFLDVMATLWQ